MGILGVPLLGSNLYDKYDDDEAQARVMSPEEYIVSDFALMAGMLVAK